MIRHMVESDKNSVVELALMFGAERLQQSGYIVTREGAESQFDSFINLPYIKAFVVEINGELVGMIVFVISPLLFTSTVAAQELVWYVKPEHRSWGVRLLKKCEKVLQELGCADIMMVGLEGDRSCDFYQHFGYAPFQRTYIKRMV